MKLAGRAVGFQNPYENEKECRENGHIVTN
jgi:hypothetical protein